MTDYNVPTSFLYPVPAWPVDVACGYFKDLAPQTAKASITEISGREKDVLTALNLAARVYYSYEKPDQCTNFTDTEGTGNLGDAEGWLVLSCNQVPMPTAMGEDSMFIAAPWDYDKVTKDCQKQYGLTPDFDWALSEFGGYDQ